MFYRPQDGDGLPHNPFKAIVSPRPIGWISSFDSEGGANLAPYSFFNAINENPPMVMFASGAEKPGMNQRKDSVANIRGSKAFCVNIVASDQSQAMNITAGHFASGVDEFEKAGLQKSTGHLVNAPYVTEAPSVLECSLFQIVDLPGPQHMVIGMVEGIHIDDRHLKDGILDVTSYQPLARMGYQDYATIREVFTLKRP